MCVCVYAEGAVGVMVSTFFSFFVSLSRKVHDVRVKRTMNDDELQMLVLLVPSMCNRNETHTKLNCMRWSVTSAVSNVLTR